MCQHRSHVSLQFCHDSVRCLLVVDIGPVNALGKEPVMYFNSMNLFIVIFVAIGVAAWFYVTTLQPTMRQSLINWAWLTFLTGVLFRSFMNDPLVQAVCLAAAIAGWYFYLASRKLPGSALAVFLVAFTGVGFGFLLRDTAHVWPTIFISAILAVPFFTGLVGRWTDAFIAARQKVDENVSTGADTPTSTSADAEAEEEIAVGTDAESVDAANTDDDVAATTAASVVVDDN